MQLISYSVHREADKFEEYDQLGGQRGQHQVEDADPSTDSGLKLSAQQRVGADMGRGVEQAMVALPNISKAKGWDWRRR